MSALELVFASGYEQVVFCQDAACGYRAILALHSTALGPATGGTRLWPYASTADALADALRLSRGMTYKNAAAGLALGGGKAVILAPPVPFDREALFLAHGRAVEQLGGRFITAEDVGTTPADFEVAARVTSWVAGIDGKGGDPSPWTARGVFAGILACAQHHWGTTDLTGRVASIQGCGNVGAALANHLAGRGVRLVVCDPDAERTRSLAQRLGATVVAPAEIYDVAADIFVPCALGAVLNDATIARLQVTIVAGAANNQLEADRHADVLAAKGILYAPDFVINAGGVISGSVALLGETHDAMVRRVDGIADTLHEVFAHARRDGISTQRAAEWRAEQALARPRTR
ncbi:MAG: amino acid dehydrogenase [Cytophagaceae bacterium]|nr:amino acid dehydrogenase [Gemmatimonadaceae bacterium]